MRENKTRQLASEHAHRRCEQRAISEQDIEDAITWGSPIRQQQGRTAYHLGRSEIAHAKKRGNKIPARAEGTIVVVGSDGGMVTAIRSKNRRRLKTTRPKRSRARRARPKGRRP